MSWLLLLLSSLSLSLSSDELSVADQLEVEVVVRGEAPYLVDLDSVRSSLDELEPYLTVEGEEVGERRDLGGGLWEQRLLYTLEPWQAGECGFSLLPLLLRSPSGETVRLESDWIPLRITLPFDEVEGEVALSPLPLGLKPRSSMSRANRESLEKEAQESALSRKKRFEKSRFFLRLLLLALLLTLLAWFGRRVWRRFDFSKGGPLVRSDPRKKALAQLGALEQERLFERGRIELYYVRMTEIVRLYIEAAYHVRAPEQTTQEFLEEVASFSQFDQEVRDLLRAFLFEADLVKFARFEPTKEQCASAVSAARGLILWEARSRDPSPAPHSLRG